MAHVTFEESSRLEWGREGGTTDLDRLKFGLMVRMTKSLEAMSRNFLQLQSELEAMKGSRDRSWAREEKLKKSVAGLRGALTKAKKKL